MSSTKGAERTALMKMPFLSKYGCLAKACQCCPSILLRCSDVYTSTTACMSRNLCELDLGEYAAVCGLTCQHKDACQTGGVAAKD